MFEHVGFPAESVRYLNMLRSDRDSIMGSGLEVPVTTGLLVLISGAALGNNLVNIVQAVDSNKWPDEKRLYPRDQKDARGGQDPGRVRPPR